MNLTLTRFGSIPGIGTFGELIADKTPFYTVEREWLNNQQYISCVPVGDYYLEKYDSPKYGPTWCLINHRLDVFKYDTNKRFGILIHPANWPDQLEGCIAVGRKIEHINHGIKGDMLGVSSSRAAFTVLKSILDPYDSHTLQIKWEHS